MPKIGSVGYSDNTSLKQKHFSEIINTHIKIVRNIFNKKNTWHDFVYYYFDLTSGIGKINGNLGSPLIFLSKIKKIKLPFKCYLVEENECSMSSLLTNISKSYDCEFDGEINLFNNKYENILNEINKNGDQKNHYGLVYIDANGMPPDFKSIIEFFNPYKKHNRYIDLMIHFPSTVKKRVRKSSNHPSEEYLSDLLNEINKNYWIIREPFGTWGWTFLIGTNWDSFPEFEHINFHRISSNKGMETFLKLNYTSKELIRKNFYKNYTDYLNHSIFKLIKKERFAYARKNGHYYGTPLCEICHENTVSEIHHIKYPPWGEFDIPENLLAICHQCHCKLHNKEN